MKNSVLILLLGMLCLTSCKQCDYDITDTTVDLGQLQTMVYNPQASYCDYSITGNDDPVQAFYKNGDKVCIECCLTSGDKWPPTNPQGANRCPKKITFLSSDGQVNYTAELSNKLEFDCKSCPNAKGYYECPN